MSGKGLILPSVSMYILSMDSYTHVFFILHVFQTISPFHVYFLAALKFGKTTLYDAVMRRPTRDSI